MQIYARSVIERTLRGARSQHTANQMPTAGSQPVRSTPHGTGKAFASLLLVALRQMRGGGGRAH